MTLTAAVSSIDVLIQLLKLIDGDETIDLRRQNHPLIKAVEYLADECLITGDCRRPDVDNTQLLKFEGFHLLPGEVDRFGWLSGWIVLNRGRILFG